MARYLRNLTNYRYVEATFLLILLVFQKKADFQQYAVISPLICKQILNAVASYFVVETLMEMPFSFRVKMGQREIEISGTREEVMKTIEELPQLMEAISKTFDSTKTEKETEQPAGSTYPSVSASGCSEAVLQLLSSEGGRQPRTLTELGEALKANAVYYPSTTVSGVLAWLVRKNKIKRWKTDKGYVYVLAGGRSENG
jgi:hypothetical protein